MAAPVVEVAKPDQKDISGYKPEPVVMETRNHDQYLLNNTVAAVQAMGKPHTVETATPASRNPVLSTTTAEAVGATNVGHEKFGFSQEAEFKRKDAKKIWERIIGKFTGGHTEKREGPEGGIWRRLKSHLRKRDRAKFQNNQRRRIWTFMVLSKYQSQRNKILSGIRRTHRKEIKHTFNNTIMAKS